MKISPEEVWNTFHVKLCYTDLTHADLFKCCNNVALFILGYHPPFLKT